MSRIIRETTRYSPTFERHRLCHATPHNITVGLAIRFRSPLHLPCIYYGFFSSFVSHHRKPSRLVQISPDSLFTRLVFQPLYSRPIKITCDDVSIHGVRSSVSRCPVPRHFFSQIPSFSLAHLCLALIDPKWLVGELIIPLLLIHSRAWRKEE